MIQKKPYSYLPILQVGSHAIMFPMYNSYPGFTAFIFMFFHKPHPLQPNKTVQRVSVQQKKCETINLIKFYQ